MVLGRGEGEEGVIGGPSNPIGVGRIAAGKGERVRVAFDVPRDVEIHRREIAEQILSEDEAAEKKPDVIAQIKPATSVVH